MRLWIDGITAMSRGISGGKQNEKKIANKNKNGRVCLLSQNKTVIY